VRWFDSGRGHSRCREAHVEIEPSKAGGLTVAIVGALPRNGADNVLRTRLAVEKVGSAAVLPQADQLKRSGWILR
jgi:hypothetical protein